MTSFWLKTKHLLLLILHKILIRVLRQGPIPQHLAIDPDGVKQFSRINQLDELDAFNIGFFMDGRKHNLNSLQAIRIRDSLGSSPMKRCILYCWKLRIRNVSLSLAECLDGSGGYGILEELMEEFIDYRELYKQLGIRVRAIGELELLPEDIQVKLAEAIYQTRNNSRMNLNYILNYSASHEMTGIVRDIVEGVKRKEITVDDINGELLTKCSYDMEHPTIDMLIRTSGETRLSDFFSWQIKHSRLFFVNALWPDFNFWHLAKAILQYQRTVNIQNQVKDEQAAFTRIERDYVRRSVRISSFLHGLGEQRHENLMKKRVL